MPGGRTENCRPEKIPLTDGLLTAVRSAHMHYRKRLDEEEAEKKKRHAEEKLKAEEVERKKREQEKLRQEIRSLKEKGESLDRKEQEEEMQTADELLSEGTVKLQTALSSGSKVDSQGAKVACLMIETAKSNQAKAKRKLEAVREKQKVVNTHKQKLLEKALPTGVSAPPSKKRKSN